MSTERPAGRLISRRTTLRLIGGAAAGAAALVGWRSDWPALSPPAAGRSAGAQTVDCVAKPELTEGPFFVDERLDRSDIRPDPATGAVKAGVPLGLAFNVRRLDDRSCLPLAGAYVDVWHTDALGAYSDVRSEGTLGQKFLRGYQVTDEKGAARFTTIYPGWYRGRAIHIHFKVRVFSGDREAYDFTSQIFFDESTTARVLAAAPYAEKGPPDTTNSRDGIYRRGGPELLVGLAEHDGGYAGSFDIALVGVPRSAGR